MPPLRRGHPRPRVLHSGWFVCGSAVAAWLAPERWTRYCDRRVGRGGRSWKGLGRLHDAGFPNCSASVGRSSLIAFAGPNWLQACVWSDRVGSSRHGNSVARRSWHGITASGHRALVLTRVLGFLLSGMRVGCWPRRRRPVQTRGWTAGGTRPERAVQPDGSTEVRQALWGPSGCAGTARWVWDPRHVCRSPGQGAVVGAGRPTPAHRRARSANSDWPPRSWVAVAAMGLIQLAAVRAEGHCKGRACRCSDPRGGAARPRRAAGPGRAAG